MDIILSGCEGTMNIADDILVFGDGDETRDHDLHNLNSNVKSQSKWLDIYVK